MVEMEHCCFCKHPALNKKHYQRLFGTAITIHCASPSLTNIKFLAGLEALALGSLEDAFSRSSINCKDCRIVQQPLYEQLLQSLRLFRTPP